MDDMKTGSIWDEVDALQEDKKDVTKREAYVRPESETAEKIEAATAFRVINSSQNGQNKKQTEKIEENESDGSEPLPKKRRYSDCILKIEKDDQADKKGIICIAVTLLCAIILIASVLGIVKLVLERNKDIKESQAEMDRLRSLKESAEGDLSLYAGAGTLWDYFSPDDRKNNEFIGEIENPEMLDKYKALYEENSDLIGWLKIDDTVIDYPVMQTPDDEEYYLHRGFDKSDNENGCLIMDTDSNVGVGTREGRYLAGEDVPTDNLIIHGHTMKNGDMFGDLDLYKDKAYADAHNIIKFDSLYESREYEVIAVFYSQVYYTTDDVFKYYKFFDANTQEEFDYWYDNIKELSLYDTGVEAQFGDQFITLSCCAYHVEDGRFVVVGKRIK